MPRRSTLALLLIALVQCDPAPADSKVVSAKDEAPVATAPEPSTAKEPVAPQDPPTGEEGGKATPEAAPNPIPPAEPEAEEPPSLKATSAIISGVQAPAKQLPEKECNELAEAADRELELLEKPCKSAADCELVDTVCPFDCHLVLSRKTKRDKAKKAVKAYFDGCFPCKAKCPLPPSELACVEGRCVDPRF